MDETVFFRFPGHHLDPAAQEFFPTTASAPLPMHPPPIYYSYPYPPPPPLCEYSPHPAYVSTDAVEPPPPPPPLPTMLQPCLPPPIMTPSRALLLSLVPPDVSESIIRRELEGFGDVRGVLMDRVRDGIVTVHFYDLRHAQTALVEIQEQHMQQQCRLRRHYEVLLPHHNSFGFVPPPPLPSPARGLISGRAVWAQFALPVFFNIPDGCNQGTLVIFNLDPNLPSTTLQHIFEPFGPVRELRDTPMKKYQKFVEFYDIRDAAKALTEMNGKEIKGKRIVIEFSRPGGYSKRFASKPNSNNNYSCSNSSLFSPPQPRTPLPTLQHKLSISRKSSYLRNPNVDSGEKSLSSSIQDSMEGLSVNGDGYEESSSKTKSNKKYMSKKGCYNSGCGKQQQQQQDQQLQQHKPKSNRLWKGSRQAKDYDPRFLINEDAIKESNCKDSRTTVMIKNIPNKYSQKLLLNMLDNHCIHCNEQIADGDDQPLSSYDFVYLPIDFINKCNVGYGFVNMTSPEATWRLYKAFHLRSWEVFNSRKICEVTYARLQGVEALQEHFKNSKFPYDADENLPVVFSPSRDGRQLTEPVPMVCRTFIDPPLRSSSSAFSSNQDQSETSYENIHDDEDDNELGGQDLLEQALSNREDSINDDCDIVGDDGGCSTRNGCDSED